MLLLYTNYSEQMAWQYVFEMYCDLDVIFVIIENKPNNAHPAEMKLARPELLHICFSMYAKYV